MQEQSKQVIIAIFLGWLGGYRFYKKQYVLGIIYLFTCGLFGIGWIVDIIVACMTSSKNNLTNNTDNLISPNLENKTHPSYEIVKANQKKILFKTHLTSTLFARNILENLYGHVVFYIQLPSDNQKSCRVTAHYNSEWEHIGNLPMDFTKMLLNNYPNHKYSITSYNITYTENGGIGCEVVVKVSK